MRRWLKWVALASAAVLLIVLFYVASRLLFYRQADDEEHVASKQAYLESIAAAGGAPPGSPSFVIVLFDDLGYGDIGAYGSRAIRTPHLDRVAAEGALLRNAYSASPYCSGARAGLATGRHALRAGLDHVVQPAGSFYDYLQRLGGLNRRLPAEEITIAEVLSAAGYATAIFGKWHLGDESPSLPQERGFDEFYGLLHSNDVDAPVVWRNDEVVERHPIDQSTLTRRYTERAARFIETHADRPFFLYLPHTFPHIPLHASAEHRGSSAAGLYGDVVEELDASVGVVVEALRKSGAERDTLLILTSDNGPWFQGSGGGTRGRKFDVFEGGMRVPFLARWPGRIPAGQVIDEPVMAIDVFPTLLEMARLPLPDDRKIDGRSLVPLLEGSEPESTEAIYFHQLSVLRAVRLGRFKYHDRHGVFFGNPMDWPWGPMRDRGPWLFDLVLDPDESYDVSDKHPAELQRLRQLLEQRKRENAANPRGWL